jgi:hypothetical protein
MAVLYIYLFSLLVMLLLAGNGALTAINHAPIKIKAVSMCVFAAAFIRIISLLVLFLARNIMFLYLLKPIIYINILYVPVIGIICIYIFMRNDKIKFSYTFIIYGLLAAFYILFIYKESFLIKATQGYGYGFYFSGSMAGVFGIITVNTIVLILCIIQLGKPAANNFGLSLLIIGSLLCNADTFLTLFGVEYMTQNILGEILFLVIFNYGLSRFKK